MANKRPYQDLERALALGQVGTWFREKDMDDKMVVFRTMLRQLTNDKLRRALHVSSRERKRRKVPIPVSALQVSDGIEQRVVALDVEKVVSPKDRLNKNKRRHLEGSVAVMARINNEIKPIFHTYVRQPVEYIYDYSTKYSGFTEAHLVGGITPAELKHKLDEIFLGAEVITYDGTDDFKSCGVQMLGLDTYDIRNCPDFRRDDEQRSIKGLKVLVEEHYKALTSKRLKYTTCAGAVLERARTRQALTHSSLC
ncbi:hypothetical protein HDE_00193 [Halotydeus destructor]|nr:hypothetical protein HDE_00193 [Halotydeus destructor]